MQQGTRANLCKLASCRLFISFPISLALCSRKIGEKEGGGGNEGRGVWSEWGDEKELRTLSIFLRLIFTLTNENVHWYTHINYGYFPFVSTDLKFRSRNRSAIVIHVYLLTQTNDLITKWNTKMGWFIFHHVNCPFSTALSLICSIYFYTKDSVNEQWVCVSDSLVEEMGGKFH